MRDGDPLIVAVGVLTALEFESLKTEEQTDVEQITQ